MIEPYKSKSVTGAKKAAGQLKKVLELLESDAYCMDILQQVRAVNGLLDSLASNVLESHLQSCAGKALTSKNEKERDKVISELVVAYKAAQK